MVASAFPRVPRGFPVIPCFHVEYEGFGDDFAGCNCYLKFEQIRNNNVEDAKGGFTDIRSHQNEDLSK
jgi:hypothetical protein